MEGRRVSADDEGREKVDQERIQTVRNTIAKQVSYSVLNVPERRGGERRRRLIKGRVRKVRREGRKGGGVKRETASYPSTESPRSFIQSQSPVPSPLSPNHPRPLFSPSSRTAESTLAKFGLQIPQQCGVHCLGRSGQDDPYRGTKSRFLEPIIQVTRVVVPRGFQSPTDLSCSHCCRPGNLDLSPGATHTC